MGKFDLGELIAQGKVSKLDTMAAQAREQLEYIDIDLIDDDSNNFYALSALEDLTSNIQLVGLQQPLRVREGEHGHVVIVSGHRRRAACRTLVDEGFLQFREIPCIRERETGSQALQELRLIYANRDTRKITDSEKMKQAERVALLLYQLKEEGVVFPGRMRDHVADACNISKTKLARLQVIREGLISTYASLFDANELPEQTAYALARLPSAFQLRLSTVLSELPTGTRVEALLRQYEAGCRWTPDFNCIDGSLCKRGDSFLRHDAAASAFDFRCGGNTCCLKCNKALAAYAPCDRACSKVKAQRKAARDETAAHEAKRKQTQQEQLHVKLQASANRLLLAADAADLPDTASFSPSPYSPKISVSRLRQYVAGDFQGQIFSRNDLDANNFSDLPKLAQFFQCSTDYLLGLSDCLTPIIPVDTLARIQQETPAMPPEPLPAEVDVWGWFPSVPPTSGLYWCVTGPLQGGGGLYWWNKEARQWEHALLSGFEVTPNIALWLPCPDLPESLSWNRNGVVSEDAK